MLLNTAWQVIGVFQLLVSIVNTRTIWGSTQGSNPDWNLSADEKSDGGEENDVLVRGFLSLRHRVSIVKR